MKKIINIVAIIIMIINTIYICLNFSLQSMSFILECLGAIWLASLGIIKGVKIVINKYIVLDSKDLPKK